MGKIRVLIADDHPLYAEGLRAILHSENDIEFAGYATDGPQALRLIPSLQPDVVVLDVRMPGLSGIEVAEQIASRFPQIRVLALSGFDSDDLVFGMIKAGAAGYILKDTSPADIALAIRNIYAGESQLTPSIARKVLQQFTILSRDASATIDTVFDGLTSREVEVLRLIANAHSNKEVATVLCISERTVENHIHNIYQKLQIHDRTQAMLYAVKKGLVSLGS